MARVKDRVKPTHYPVLPFHAIRCAQLVSSIIVACVMAYFLRELSHDHYSLPWTFILLLAVSLLTLFSLSATIVLHCFYGLNPLLNTILNGALLVLWIISFALLSSWSSSTLTHVCNKSNWDNNMGISICRIYKALFSFALFGLVATLLALILDIHVQRNSTRRGRFAKVRMGDMGDGKGGLRSIAGEESNPNPMARGGARRGGEGYAVPEEQFGYDDTEYRGAGGQVERRSLDHYVDSR